MYQRSGSRWIGGSVGVLGLLLLLAWMQGWLNGERVSPGREIPAPVSAAGLKTVPAQERADPVVTGWPGTVIAKTKAVLSAQIPARVVEVTVRQGDLVKRGTVLVRLDSEETLARFKQAEAAWSGATARRKQAEATYRRMKTLIVEEVVALQQFEAAEAAFQTAQAEEEAARRQRKAAEVVLDFTTVTAPFDGRVTRREVEPGEFATAGRPLLALDATDLFHLETPLPLAEEGGLQLGQRHPVEIAGLPAMQGTIDEIVPAADPETRTVTVKVLLPRGVAVRSGLFGRLLLSGAATKGVFVPKSAVREIGQLETVRVLEAGRIITRHVQTGRETGEEIEILSGLRANEQVVVEGGA